MSQRLHTIQRKSSLVVKSNSIDGKDKFYTLDAVTDGTDSAVVVTRKILFELECNNNICHPDLFIELSTDLTNRTRFVIGSRPDLQLFVKVNNSGDNAYLAKAVIDIPIFIGVLKLQSECGEHSANNTHSQIICDIDHPFAKNKTVSYVKLLKKFCSYSLKIFLHKKFPFTNSLEDIIINHRASLF